MTFDSASRRLAIVGTDSDVDLWDLAALHDGLTAIGLAWDRPAPPSAPMDAASESRVPSTPQVAIIRPGPAEPGRPPPPPAGDRKRWTERPR